MPKKKKGAARPPPKAPAEEPRVEAAEFPAAATEATEPPDSARRDETSAAHVADDASSEEPIATSGPATPEEEETPGAERASEDPPRGSDEDSASARDDPCDPLATEPFDAPSSAPIPTLSDPDPNLRSVKHLKESEEEEERVSFSDEAFSEDESSFSDRCVSAQYSDDPALLREVVRELRERLGESRGDLQNARERDGRRAAALVDLRDRQLAITEELAVAAENEEAARVAINALVARAERAERRAADAELRVAEQLWR